MVGHTYAECESTWKRCLNCELNHSAISFSCKRRKEAIIRIKEASSRKTQMSPAWISPESSLARSAKSGDDIFKSLMCLMIAAASESDTAGSFEATLKELQAINDVPQFKMGNVELPSLSSLRNAVGINMDDFGSVVGRNEATTANKPIPDQPDPVAIPNGSRSSIASSAGPLSSGSSGTSRRFPTITVIKKKTAPTVTAATLEKMFSDGNILFENSVGLSQKECLAKLKGNLLECKLALSKVKVKDFRSLRNNNSS